MTDKSICGDEGLEYAKKLVSAIEQGDESAAHNMLEELSALRESTLFQELGKLTRDLHNTLNDFQLDSKISEMTEKDIPDAKERLNHVINMTQDAAEQTLSAVEASLPISDELSEQANKLQESWERFRKRDMDVTEFRELSKEIEAFFDWLNSNTPALQTNLSNILLAQGFQDLTGQIIGKVIKLVQEVEESLVDLIRITGQKMQPQTQKDDKTGPDISAQGPVVPGVDKGDVVSGQDEVDDLLSSLGF